MSYIGNSPENVLRNRRAIYEFVATAGQTAFSGVDSNGATLDLLQDNEQSVFLNGVRIIATDDYTVSGETLTLTQAASVGDILIVETQGEVANATTYTRSEADARYVNYNGDVISGNIQIAGDLTASSLAIDTNTLYVDATNNRVGINLTGLNPQEALHVAGNIRVNNNQEFRTVDSGGSTRTIMRVNGSDQLEYGWSGAGPVKFMGGGSYTERMRIHTNSNIGIGTDNPPSILSVRKTTTTYEDVLSIIGQNSPTDIMGALGYDQTADTMIIRNDQTYATGGIAFRAGGSNNHLFIQTGGQVGIGTDAPKADFHVVGADNNNLIVQNSTYQNSGQNTEAAIRLKVTASSDDERAKAGILLKNDGSAYGRGDLHFLVDSNDDNGNAVLADSKMVISHEGNVGIGTDGPTSKLHIMTASNGASTVGTASDELILENSADCGLTIRSGSSDDGVISFADADDHNVGQVFYSHSSNSMTFRTNDSVQMTIDSSGTVDVASDVISNNAKLKALAKDISDTAVDIFVYDTRKDSDGGAWRKRTQNTSWYNEALNTSVRGVRKEFPCVAVIVAESGTLTIYDGDDPDMPMWMVFNGTSDYGSYLGRTSGAGVTSVHMLNGNLCVGRGNSGYGEALLRANFISEHAVNYAVAGWRFRRPIVDRNLYDTYNVELNYVGINPIIGIAIRDVDMIVLPNAPINADTGLPEPTIAVATSIGISVIKDDGEVYDITHTTYNNSYQVKFLPTGGIAYTTDSSSNQRWLHVDRTLPSIDISKANGYEGHLDDEMYHTVNNSTYNGQDLKFGLNRFNSGFEVTNQGDIVAGATISSSVGGLGFIGRNIENPSRGLIAEVSTSYNSGWLPGDIKLATLSDTDATDVTGSELVTNSTFSDTSVWSLGAGWSISGGKLRKTSNDNNSAMDTITTVIGKTYTISVIVDTAANGSYIYANDNYSSDNMTSAGEWCRSFIATSTSTLVGVTGVTGNGLVIDSFSVRIAEADRSYNEYGLQVFGLIDKDPVETGADLVAYSGFTNVRYLKQPYHSDLNFTDEMSVMCWVKNWDNGHDLLHRGPLNTRNQATSFFLYCDGGYDIRFALSPNGTTEYNYEIPLDNTPAGWQHVCFTLKSGVVTGYLNGIQRVSALFAGNIFSQATAQNGIYIGDGPVAAAFNGSVSLVRISGTAPSKEQVARIYNDEKVLFQENAQATIYGTTDTVLALAYDKGTELLHVGTGAGRSVFQGLRRIDNTTDGLGAAISASNGLVAED
jgi:hypothetical protein